MMKHIGAIIAVATTVLAIGVIAVFGALPATGQNAAAVLPTVPPVMEMIPVAAPRDASALQAAYAAREALLLTQIQNLDRELADRRADYDGRVAELIDLLVTGRAQLADLEAQELLLQTQIEELQAVREERETIYAGQRQQANYQYQVNIDQLIAQLEEANTKLADARAQLGQ